MQKFIIIIKIQYYILMSVEKYLFLPKLIKLVFSNFFNSFAITINFLKNKKIYKN